eukprot:153501-Chlamydomonas_euryale.AAC.2
MDASNTWRRAVPEEVLSTAFDRFSKVLEGAARAGFRGRTNVCCVWVLRAVECGLCVGVESG